MWGWWSGCRGILWCALRGILQWMGAGKGLGCSGGGGTGGLSASMRIGCRGVFFMRGLLGVAPSLSRCDISPSRGERSVVVSMGQGGESSMVVGMGQDL